jgi:hypothetical protein
VRARARSCPAGTASARGLLRLGLLSPASGRLRAGPELGFASTAYEREERRGGVLVRSGYQNAWYAAMRGHYDLLGTPLRPFVTLGLGWQWRDQADPAWIAGGGVAYRLEGAPVTWCLEWRILASLTDRPEGGDEPLYTGTFGLRFH